MCTKLHLELTREQLALVFGQIHWNMRIDYRQHSILSEEKQVEDVDSFLTRQRERFSILIAIKDAFEGELPEGLRSHYRDAEGIMLFARGFGNGQSGGANTAAPSDSSGDKDR